LGQLTNQKQLTINQCSYPITQIYYNYKNLEIEFEQENGQIVMARLATISRFYHADRGIRVGDSLAKAQVAYPTLCKQSLGKTVVEPAADNPRLC
jgi:hypothetical protein